MNTLRPTLIAFGVVAAMATVASGFMTLRGETKEASAVTICAAAAWPMIPANCLEGGSGRTVRNVSMERVDDAVSASPGQLAMQARFDTAFQ